MVNWSHIGRGDYDEVLGGISTEEHVPVALRAVRLQAEFMVNCRADEKHFALICNIFMNHPCF